MKKTVSEKNYAYIDAQNVHRGIKALGWELDWARFRIYLQEKYSVTQAHMFLGFLPKYEDLYTRLRNTGYILHFKPVLPDKNGGVKGNVDGDMILHAALSLKDYNKAVIISSDGDFYSLVEHLYKQDKLKVVLSPHIKTCSTLLKKSAREKIYTMHQLEEKLSKKKSTA